MHNDGTPRGRNRQKFRMLYAQIAAVGKMKHKRMKRLRLMKLTEPVDRHDVILVPAKHLLKLRP